MPFVFLDARCGSPVELVPIAAILSRMNRNDGPMAAPFLNPDYGIRGQPVVGMNYVEVSDEVLDGIEVVDENATHVVNFINKILMQLEIAPVVVDAVDAVVVRLPMSAPREDVDFMASSFQPGRQLGDVNGDTSHCDRMERFPREQCYTHVFDYLCCAVRLRSSYRGRGPRARLDRIALPFSTSMRFA